MSKASQIIILCEDKAHEVFVKRFLKKGWSVKPRAIRVRPYPGGKGSGKKHVTDKVCQEVEALRKRHASTVLLVVQDADELSIEQVKANLDAKLSSSRMSYEHIAYIIPKWHIQTWIAYLDEVNIDEKDKVTYKKKYGKISEQKNSHPFIDSLAANCKEDRLLLNPPDSLVAACEEFNRIRNVL